MNKAWEGRGKATTKVVKVPTSLLGTLDEIMKTRIKNDIDKVGRKYQNYPRFFRAIERHKTLKEDLKVSKFIDDENAQFTTFNIFTFIIVAFLAVVLFGGLIYTMGLLNNVFTQVGVINDAQPVINSTFPCIDNSSATCHSSSYVNYTFAAQSTFGVLNSSIQALRLVALTLIFGIAISVIVTNALVKINPIFFFVYVLIIFLAVIFSAPVSNAYENLLNSGIYGGLLTTFTGANFLLLNLPIVVTVIGILGGIFLFINIVRSEGSTNLT